MRQFSTGAITVIDSDNRTGHWKDMKGRGEQKEGQERGFLFLVPTFLFLQC